ncbi:MAG TPA: TIGR02221 family CRISPR-associated protein [Chthonomonadales bacterium]|nr:TIGR02221 family CRISPR-associated protein [Chthonomonadales bacterium]
MSRVLVSFIGRGSSEGGLTRDGYAAAIYRFPAEGEYRAWDSRETSLFGAALLQHMTNRGTPIDSWLVMGTAQSTWGALSQAVPGELHAKADEVKSKVEDGRFREADVAHWQTSIAAHLEPLKVLLRITGQADTEESQVNIWAALLDAVADGDQVLLDITHAFRHMPVLAAFMIGALRWIRKVTHVDLYYGGLELASDAGIASVIHIHLVESLMMVSDSVATYRNTGSFEPLLGVLGLGADEKAQAVVLADELNRHVWEEAREQAELLRRSVRDMRLDRVRGSVKPVLRDALSWADEQDEGCRLRTKARFAFDHRQYARAVSLLWEALLITGCRLYHIGDPTEPKSRQQAEERLQSALHGRDKDTLYQIEFLRNGVAHGTAATNTRTRVAVTSLAEFHRLYEDGDRLLAKLQSRY